MVCGMCQRALSIFAHTAAASLFMETLEPAEIGAAAIAAVTEARVVAATLRGPCSCDGHFEDT